MTELEKDIYIQLLETYIHDVELDLYLMKAEKSFHDAINAHLEKQKTVQPQVLRPVIEPNWVKTCQACGLRLDGPMGYVCPNTQCPSGLGNVFVD